ncbi:hypothetical protein BSKO_13284 [Bryopsis sp. KO-2023]|nr:hypothetical protein BSKO_13284 [Bryopsis sp. KO-2023]
MAHSVMRMFAQRMRHSAFRAVGQQAESGQELAREMRRALAADNVPDGHKASDLTDSACNISLQRMRDLTLRQDLKLHDGAGPSSIKQVFQGQRVLLVGLPGGKVCAEKHLAGYLEKLGELKAKELDKVICVVPGDCELLKKKKEECKGNDKVAFVEDRGYGFSRMLGMDRGGEGPPTQRYAGIVENGILLKLKVEKHPREVDVSSIDNILKLWDDLNNKK